MDIKTSTEPTSLRREREYDEGGASFRIGYRSIGGIISTKRPVYSRCRCVMFEGSRKCRIEFDIGGFRAAIEAKGKLRRGIGTGESH